MKNELYLVAEGGWGSSNISYTDLAYTTQNNFFRLGINRSLLDSNNLVVLQVQNKEELARLAYDATVQGHRLSCFKEPDLDDELTAVALEPQAKMLVQRLPLALAS